MVRPAFDAGVLQQLLSKRKIATLLELKNALGTTATMTVFRKLKALEYRTSYSHRGKYYTLVDIPEFDQLGLWSHRAVWFSKYGNLLETTQELVQAAEAGFTAGELQRLLHVEVKEPLLKLYRERYIEREELDGVYVYLSHESGQKRNQQLLRERRPAHVEVGVSALSDEVSHELKAGIVLFYSFLDEKQRRLYAGLESQKLGHGGDRKVAQLLGLDVHTVARGRREVLGGEVERGRVRTRGGGRKRAEKKRQR